MNNLGAVLMLVWSLGPGMDQQSGRFENRWTGYPSQRPALGEKAPDFRLQDLNGKELRLQDLIGKKPIVIEFGSYS